MATISKLMENKSPGSVKVRHEKWDLDQYFIPYFQDTEDGDWYGLDHTGISKQYGDCNNLWTLYTEPRKKVAMYLWAVEIPDKGWLPITQFFKHQRDLISYLEKSPLTKNYQVDFRIQRLDYTRIEVEEA